MLSILIPTRNRWGFLGRLLRHYSHFGMPYPIFIGDSSDPDQCLESESVLKEVSGRLNVDVRLYPGVSNLATGLDLLERVSTPYVVSTADDDFLVVRGVRKAMDFLEEYPDYSTAHGDAILFSVSDDKPYGRLTSVGRYPQHSVERECGAKRLMEHLKAYKPTVHSVHRTDHLRDSYRRVIELKMDNNFGELAPSCIPTIRGKVKKLKTLYMVRQAHADMTSRKTSPKVFDWITTAGWPEQWARFSDCLSEEIVRQDKISADEARQAVQRAFWMFLAKALTLKWHVTHGVREGLASSWLESPWRIPDPRKVWEKAQAFLSGEGAELSLKTVLQPPSPHHADFMPIYQTITSL